ncbi:MAG: calpain-6 [Alphaproteobacteria bacterium]|jgi:Ca2+-binding EF-hand superfamily protein|nr:calpain-6 [Alphaproteobacteria bacterium]
MKILICAAATAFLSVAGTARAETPVIEKYASIEAVPKVLLADLRRGESYRDQYVARLLEVIRHKDPDAKGLTKADVDAFVKSAENAKRRERYQQVIFYDLDFDGTILQQEVSSVMIEDRRRQKQSEESCIDDAARFVARYDADKDGKISLQEMSMPETGEGNNRKDPMMRRMGALLALDPNADGTLTAAELEALARKAFATIDANGDGNLSREESQNARDAIDDY